MTRLTRENLPTAIEKVYEAICKKYNLTPITLILKCTDYLKNLDGKTYGVYYSKSGRYQARIIVSRKGYNAETLIHEIAHHYQEERLNSKTAHDSSYNNACKIISNYLNKKYNLKINLKDILRPMR